MDLRSSSVFRYYFWVGLVLILMLTFLKPAGTDDSGLVDRFLIWTLQIALLLPLLIWLHVLLQSVNVFNNLKDAIADLKPDVGGIQTHRSYWVSDHHIQSMIADRGRTFILATGSRRIPVSRRKLSDIRQYVERLNLKNHE